MTDLPSLLLDLGIDEDALGDLIGVEIWWRDHQEWLAQHGYILRPRYRHGWTPSWKTHPDKSPFSFEDRQTTTHLQVLDAVRISDNRPVALKMVKPSLNPHEVGLSQYLSSESLRTDPRNHCVPILDVLPVPDDPDSTILVMPFLRACASPSWTTFGEVVAFLTQIFEGLQFMHEINVAHRDCMESNIMYDPRPLYRDLFHPVVTDKRPDLKGKAKHSTRTACPVRYYFIDFGISRRYSPEDGPPRELPIRGGDKSVPEFQNWGGEPLDPFPTDIYYLGSMIRGTILEKYKGVGLLRPLVQDMVQHEPSKRPTIQEVARRFDEVVKSISQRRLRSRLVPKYEDPGISWFKSIPHAFRTLHYIFARKPAVPFPP